jgi:predicted O-methyltransferase YrrM
VKPSLLGLDQPEGATGTGHLVWGGMPVELEMAELLYATVRYLKPRLVVESGTGSGRSTQAMAVALRENRAVHHDSGGALHTYEAQEKYFRAAREWFADSDIVRVFPGVAREQETGDPDMAFVDTGHDREEEIAHWLSHPARPLVVVHDGNRDYGSFALGEGVVLPGYDGVWIGRGKKE